MPEIKMSSQQCATKHTPKQRISKPHVVKLSGVRGKNKPDVYARNEKAEPAPQVKMLTLRQNPRQQPPSKPITTPRKKSSRENQRRLDLVSSVLPKKQ